MKSFGNKTIQVESRPARTHGDSLFGFQNWSNRGPGNGTGWSREYCAADAPGHLEGNRICQQFPFRI